MTRASLNWFYFTQLLGIVLGIPSINLALEASFVPLGEKLSALMEVHYA